MKKLIAIVLSSLLLIGAAVGGTLALASDEERTVNVYTAGNIDIALVNGENEQLTLFPAVYNFADYDTAEKAFAKTDANGYWTALRNVYQKDLAVKNVGKNDSYIRVIVAYENPKIDDTKYFFNECVVLNEVTAGITKTPLGNAMIDGTNYALVSYQFNGAVTPDANAKHVVLRQLALKTGTTSEQMAKIGGAYDIMVCAQAVQTDLDQSKGGNSPEAMLNEAFYKLSDTMHPWAAATEKAGYTATEFPGIYTGEKANTYYVFSKNGLMNLNDLFAEINPNEAKVITVELMSDIDLLGEVWEPINSMWVTFNGNGHTIKNLNAPGMDATGRRSGFWAYAGAVTINALTLENVTVNGSQAGIFAGSADGLTITDCYLKGNNTVNFVAGVETWNGIGAITGVATGSKMNVNVTILEGTTVTLNRGTMVTDLGCKYIDDFTGHIVANRGTVVNNGNVVSTGSIFYAVSNSDQLATVINSGATGVFLKAGNYTADLYNISDRDALTILGSGAETKLAFKNQQVRACQFKSLTISNCTIEHMADKAWGHLVLASADSADGVYTISNCIFNGVGTQGIYINEKTSGVTYNIENCIFDGDFGGEGAITIQNNEGVAVKVNVDGCTFNNIPATSHEIYKKYNYTGLILTIDGKYFVNSDSSLEAALNAATDNTVNLALAAGNYTMPSVGGNKEVTIVGTKDTVIDNTMGAYMDGSKVSFEGVTIKGSTGMANGNGSDYAALYTENVTYTNCTFDGPFRIGRDGATFINCTFTNLGNDYIWTYGNDVTFIGCTFNTDGKAILIYSDGGNEVSKVTVKDCVFNATQGAKAGAIANQNCAAIEIHNYGNGVDLTTEGNTYNTTYFSGEWRIKTYETGRTKVFVNGTEYTQIAIDGKLMTIDASKNVTVNG